MIKRLISHIKTGRLHKLLLRIRLLYHGLILILFQDTIRGSQELFKKLISSGSGSKERYPGMASSSSSEKVSLDFKDRPKMLGFII